MLPGARTVLTDIARAVFAAEAAGIAAGVTEPGQRLRQDAGAVRSPDRNVPGGQASLREHAGRGRTHDRRRLGRGPGRGRPAATSSATRPRSPATLCAHPGRGDQRAASTSRCTAASGSPWEHDAHLYLRRAAAHCGGRRRRASRQGRHRPWSVAASAGRPRSTCPPRPGPIQGGHCRPGCGPAAQAGRRRKEVQALIETGYVMPHMAPAVGQGRERDRAAWSSSRSSRRPASSGRRTASPGGSSSPSSSTPARTRSPGGCARR